MSCADRITLRPREVAQVTGYSLSTVYRWIEGGDLEVIETEGGLAVYVTDLLEFLDERRGKREREGGSTEDRAKALIERTSRNAGSVR